MKPYTVIEDDTNRTVYEYKTIYLWALYILAALTASGLIFKNEKLMLLGLTLLMVYIFLVSTQFQKLGKKIKVAMKEGNVEMTGSKWSFTRPLRVAIPKPKT